MIHDDSISLRMKMRICPIHKMIHERLPDADTFKVLIEIYPDYTIQAWADVFKTTREQNYNKELAQVIQAKFMLQFKKNAYDKNFNNFHSAKISSAYSTKKNGNLLWSQMFCLHGHGYHILLLRHGNFFRQTCHRIKSQGERYYLGGSSQCEYLKVQSSIKMLASFFISWSSSLSSPHLSFCSFFAFSTMTNAKTNRS